MKTFFKLAGAAIVLVLLLVAFEIATGIIEMPVAYPLNDKTVALIQGSTSVETFRVEMPMLDTTTPEGEKQFDKLKPFDYYEVTAVGPTETGAYLQRLKDLMLSRQSYYHDSSKCELDPGTILRMKSPKGYVDIVQCFHCNEMVVQSHLPNGDWSNGGWGGQLGNRSAFLKLVKEAFPNDAEIKSLT